MNSKQFMPNEKLQSQMIYGVLALGMVLAGVTASVWWLFDSLQAGTFSLLGMMIFSIHNGINVFRSNEDKQLFLFVFVLPTIIATAFYLIGFFVR